jgi:hypothetical protein
MFNITFYRFTPRDIGCDDVTTFETTKHDVLSIEDKDINEEIIKAIRWLKDHYGYFVVKGECGNTVCKHCNHKKMRKDLETAGLNFKICDHEK